MIFLLSFVTFIFTLVARWLWNISYSKTCYYLISPVIILFFASRPSTDFPYLNVPLLINTLIYFILLCTYTFLKHRDEFSTLINNFKKTSQAPVIIGIILFIILLPIQEKNAYLTLSLCLSILPSYFFILVLSALTKNESNSAHIVKDK